VGNAVERPMELPMPLHPQGQLMERQEGSLVADAAHDLLDIGNVGRELLTCHMSTTSLLGTYLKSLPYEEYMLRATCARSPNVSERSRQWQPRCLANSKPG
jgi:hypothetical protein